MNDRTTRLLIQQIGSTDSPRGLCFFLRGEISVSSRLEVNPRLRSSTGFKLEFAQAESRFGLIGPTQDRNAVFPVLNAFLDRRVSRRRDHRSFKRGGADRALAGARR